MYGKRALRAFLFVCIALLFVVSIPWYRTTGSEVHLVWGLPDWVAVSLLCYVGVAVLNALAWLLSEVEDGATSVGSDDASADSGEKG